MTRIVQAAIKFTDGKVYVGKRHHDCIRIICEQTGAKRVGTGSVQGFVTDTGEFVDREQAAVIALACKQIERLKYSRTELFSEDLY